MFGQSRNEKKASCQCCFKTQGTSSSTMHVRNGLSCTKMSIYSIYGNKKDISKHLPRDIYLFGLEAEFSLF